MMLTQEKGKCDDVRERRELLEWSDYCVFLNIIGWKKALIFIIPESCNYLIDKMQCWHIT